MTGEPLAWAWVAHLRDGGTTTWREWCGTPGPGATRPAEARGRHLPGAQQLELLRRLNVAGQPSVELVRRVLEASAPGRGTPDLELAGVADESPFGPRPVDPADLPDAELTRVASLLIAEDVVAHGPRQGARPGAPSSPRRGVPRPWRRRYRLVGDPWLTDPVRAELVRRGRPPGERGATVYVCGTDLASMLVHAWSARSFAEGAPPWPEWLEARARTPRVPPRADLVAAAARWSERVGRHRVEIVVDPARLGGLLGVRGTLPGPPAYSADAVELARRVGAALGLLVPPGDRPALLRHGLGPRLAGAPGPALAVPTGHLARVQRQAADMRDALLAAGYPVHGDPDALVPRTDSGSEAPGADSRERAQPVDAGVLALALRLLLGLEEPEKPEKPEKGVR